MLQQLGIGGVILAAVLPLTARAAWGPLAAGFCAHCQLPLTTCGCAQPAPILQPVVQTELQTRTQIVNVPVPVTRQVTVDQGSYQQVWVPKLVARQVTETVMQPQVRQVQVPVQVVRQVAVPQPACGAGFAQTVLNPPAGLAAAPRNDEQMTQQPAAGQQWQKVPRRVGALDETIQQQSYQGSGQVAEVAPLPLAPAVARPLNPAPSAITAWRAQSHLR